MKRISFIMPSFNRAGYIAESIESVLAQMQADDELLVVDDGSTDDPGQAIAGLSGVELLRHPSNRGKGAALMTGLAAAARVAGGTTGPLKNW